MANDAFKNMHGRRMEAKYKNKEESRSSDLDSRARITPNGAIIGEPPRYLGAKIGEKLKGAYEVRQIRKGQIKNAGQTIHETTRDRENPEIDKGGPEYDE